MFQRWLAGRATLGFGLVRQLSPVLRHLQKVRAVFRRRGFLRQRQAFGCVTPVCLGWTHAAALPPIPNLLLPEPLKRKAACLVPNFTLF